MRHLEIIRRWVDSNLSILRRRQDENPQSVALAAKIAILGDLSRNLDVLRAEAPAAEAPNAVEVTYGNWSYIFDKVTRILVLPAPDTKNYSIECAWHTDGTLTVVPSCSIRMVGQDELNLIDAKAEAPADDRGVDDG